MALAALCVSSPARATGDLGGSGKFVGWWELGGFYGTDGSSRGEAVLFTPLAQSASTIFFLDARGKLFEDDVQEANLALGYRQMMSSGWNFGVWAGWDVRDTEIDNTFHQVSFGLEALSERFDVRVNGYVPVTDPKVSPSTAEVVLQGNNIFLIGGEEVALYGVDAEVGMLLFGRNRDGGGGLKGAPAPASRHELRGYVGGFWFDHDDAIEEVAGPKGRLEYRINDVISSLPGSRLTVESELSYDEVRDTKFEIGARIRIPFGARGSDAAARTAALTGQELRMIEGLERDTDIITVRSKEENVIDEATDMALNDVSFAKNANQFANAVDAGGNRLIILQRNGAQIDVSGTDGQQLRKRQTVQGGASTILVRGARSGVVKPFTAPGKRPTLFSDDANLETGVISMASNTHLVGVNIRGAGDENTPVDGNNGIVAAGDSNVVIEQIDIRQMGNYGMLLLDGNSNVRIYHTDISNTAQDGFDLFGIGNSDITLKHITVSDTAVGARGIDFGGGNRNIIVEDATLRRIGQVALATRNNTNVTFKDISVADGNDIGIFVNDLNRNVTIENATISNEIIGITIDDNNRNLTVRNIDIRKTDTGIDISDGSRDFTFENISIADISGNGIDVGNNNRNITFKDVTIRNAGNAGIAFGQGNRNVEIADTTIRNTGLGVGNGEGIFFDDDNSNVTLEHVSIRNYGTEGIAFEDNNSNVTIRHSSVAGTGSFGISIGDGNSNFTLANNSISGTGSDGIFLNGGNSITITGNTLTNIGSEAIDVGGAAANTLTITDNIFAGTIGGDAVEFDGAVDTLLDGSGNQLAPGAVVVGSLCDLSGGGFVGTLEIGAVTFVNGAGCT